MGSHKKEKKAKKDKKKKKKRERSDDEMGDNPVTGGAYVPPKSDKDSTFTWSKKLALEGTDKLSEDVRETMAKAKEQEKKIELWKVQRRREERELERAARAEELDRARLEKENEMFKEWQEQEGKFHLTQAQLRSEIRIKEDRANPIDLLAYYINHSQDITPETEVIGEPLTVIQNISIRDLEDLQADIQVYKDLDRAQADLQYWTDLEVIVEAQLKLRRSELAVDRSRKVVNTAVSGDVSRVLGNKTSSQLVEMHAGIKKKIAGGGAIDVAYWEHVRDDVFVEISRARLREKHVAIMKHREFADRTKAAVAGFVAAPLFPVSGAGAASGASGAGAPKAPTTTSLPKDSKISDLMQIRRKDESERQCLQQYEDMCYTPIRIDAVEMDAIIYTDARLEKELREARAVVLSGSHKSVAVTTVDRGDLEEQAEALMGVATEDEELFNCDMELGEEERRYTWSEQYKPRKPRFYNRVHTGYEWNKYNQTHYDQDNPPPKIVQGYKFNIFYQDLIDKSSTPRYTVKVCPDNKEFSILKISAGPPYEDIAFKILNKEWEYSNRYSFKSQFSQGIFQLWFQFKRYRYRR